MERAIQATNIPNCAAVLRTAIRTDVVGEQGGEIRRQRRCSDADEIELGRIGLRDDACE